jgi:preprotein translocase subunit Sec61beta
MPIYNDQLTFEEPEAEEVALSPELIASASITVNSLISCD